MNRKSIAWISSALLVGGITAFVYLQLRKSRSQDKEPVTHPYVNDPVDLYVEESFPASDPPGYTPISRVGRAR